MTLQRDPPKDAQVDAALEAYERRPEVGALRAALADLPDPTADELAWRRLRDRLADQSPAPARPRVRAASLASAAGVAMAAFALVLWLGYRPDEGAPPQPPLVMAPPEQSLVDLMARSRQLERRYRQAGLAMQSAPEGMRAGLLYRIADVDRDLYRLRQAPGVRDGARERRLWRQRVTLLETMVSLQGQADAARLQRAY